MQLWALSTGDLLREVITPSLNVSMIMFARLPNALLWTTKLWNGIGVRMLNMLDSPEGPFASRSFDLENEEHVTKESASSNHPFLVTSSAKNITVRDLKTGDGHVLCEIQVSAAAVAIVPNKPWLVLGSYANDEEGLRMWDTQTRVDLYDLSHESPNLRETLLSGPQVC